MGLEGGFSLEDSVPRGSTGQESQGCEGRYKLGRNVMEVDPVVFSHV